jgi:hypothetical protein
MVAAAMAVAAFLFFAGPGLLVSDQRIGSATGDALKQEEQRLKARNDARTAGIQLVGVLAVVVGSALTWRTVRLTREGQITDRFANAIENLDPTKAVPTQLGAIYALERIARDSRRDHWPVMEILTGYLREKADPWPRQVSPGSTYVLKKEVQAVLTVMGRRRVGWDGTDNILRLEGLDLRNARLEKADLRRANLSESNLSGAFLEHSRLDSAVMRATLFRAAILPHARARKATIGGDFTGATIDHVDFRGATYKQPTFDSPAPSTARGLPSWVSSG